jgi:hypothetical protein
MAVAQPQPCLDKQDLQLVCDVHQLGAQALVLNAQLFTGTAGEGPEEVPGKQGVAPLPHPQPTFEVQVVQLVYVEQLLCARIVVIFPPVLLSNTRTKSDTLKKAILRRQGWARSSFPRS